MDDERKPDHTDDPREQGIGQGGYPESNPAATQDDDAAGSGPGGASEKGGGDTGDAPSPSTDKEADRGASTGNRNAAG
ncbi:MAG: hypothetical protein QOK49_187 [Baekduia sp.]|jgi:hypothetical protein|nr:hypothetical protein [Baekduia sp.]